MKNIFFEAVHQNKHLKDRQECVASVSQIEPDDVQIKYQPIKYELR